MFVICISCHKLVYVYNLWLNGKKIAGSCKGKIIMKNYFSNLLKKKFTLIKKMMRVHVLTNLTLIICMTWYLYTVHSINRFGFKQTNETSCTLITVCSWCTFNILCIFFCVVHNFYNECIVLQLYVFIFKIYFYQSRLT